MINNTLKNSWILLVFLMSQVQGMSKQDGYNETSHAFNQSEKSNIKRQIKERNKRQAKETT